MAYRKISASFLVFKKLANQLEDVSCELCDTYKSCKSKKPLVWLQGQSYSLQTRCWIWSRIPDGYLTAPFAGQSRETKSNALLGAEKATDFGKEHRKMRHTRQRLLALTRLESADMFLLVKFLSASLVLVLLAGPVLALDEATVFDQMIELYSQDLECAAVSDDPAWERGFVANQNDGYRVRYSRFGCEIGPRGSIVLFPGRGEGSFEYYETAIDFIERGFEPVYVLDHRGQGMSPRLLEDPHKGHVERFDDYVDDAAAFVTFVTIDLTSLGAGPKPAMYLTSNSMGGAIGIGLFQRLGEDNPFIAAAFLGAMIDVNYHSFTGTPTTWWNLKFYSETAVLMQARWRCGVSSIWNEQKCNDYAVTSASDGYVPETRRFVANSQLKMTHSANRYDLRTHMMDRFDWSIFAELEYAANENWSGPQLGGATNAWVREAARFNRQMRRSSSLKKMVHVPLMLLTGTEDLRAYQSYPERRKRAPDLSRHTEFCDDLNAASLAAMGQYVCEFVALPGGYHELYKERDLERRMALDTVDWFFRANGQGATKMDHLRISKDE
jgi:lysophospholipase